MPRYRGRLTLEDEGADSPVVHLFDYSSEEDKSAPKSSYKKQLIALESCIYVGRRNLAAKSHAHAAPKSQLEDKTTLPKDQSEDTEENNPSKPTNCTPGTKAQEPMTNGEAKEEEEEEEENSPLKEGQEFQGYFLKCPNGPYDYATKIWDHGKAAPPEVGYPQEGQEVAALVVDRAGDYLTVASGPNIAFARRKDFLCAGVDPDDLSLPFGSLRVTLRRAEQRPPEVPAACWEARPTQVVVPPYDIY